MTATSVEYISQKLATSPLPSSSISPLTPPLTPKRSLSPALSTSRKRYAAPSTHYLDEQPRIRLTPAIGVQFEKEFQLKDVLALPEGEQRKNGLLRELAYQISAHGVAFFPSQDLTPQDLETLALALGKASDAPVDSGLHIHPTSELNENGTPKSVGTISNVASKDGRMITFKDERSDLASHGWHTDISFEPRPARYSMLRMTALPPSGGDTLFSSAYSHYDMLSLPMKEFLSNLKATHSGAMFRRQARKNGFDLHLGPRGAPENVGDDFEASHPIIRTNPVTGFNGLFVNQTFTERIEGVGFDESKILLDYLFKLQAQAHDAMVRYRWNVNDLAIWDNSAANHCATFDYSEYRTGDRTVCVGEIPYFDREEGKSRKQSTGSYV
ncbi:TauD/TfdA dioxygenase family protein [Sporobolomyces salmoneus]|uniref:TauD/TfdA dioxygenase family protein n=1 Tax=Sporobolomyces salmoneus TaxID=183962 RepID=UPI003181A487